MTNYFVTATDTDAGKTYVVCQLLKWAQQQGLIAHALKPIASGGNSDILQLQQHNSDPSKPINRWLYDTPVSPHLAARLADETFSIQDIAAFCQSESHGDFQLIEGAGGLLVPLNEQHTWLDWLKLMNIPVILVVAIRLGCINHALLTDAVLAHNQIRCAGWIANILNPETLCMDEVIETLEQKMSMPLLTKVHFCGNIDKFESI